MLLQNALVTSSREDLGLLSLWLLASDSHTLLLTPQTNSYREENSEHQVRLDSPPDVAVEADPSQGRDSSFFEVPSASLSKRDSLGLPNLSSLTKSVRSKASDRAEAES